MTPPYLVKVPDDKRGEDVYTVSEESALRVRFGAVYREEGLRLVQTGVNKHKLEIRGAKVVKGTGLTYPHAVVFLVDRTAAAVKAVLRRMRPEEAATLAEFDAKIEELQAQIKLLRTERQRFVQQTAWPRAHVVRLAEVEEKVIPWEEGRS